MLQQVRHCLTLNLTEKKPVHHVKIYKVISGVVTPLKNTAEFAFRQTPLIICAFSFHCKSAKNKHFSKINIFCGCLFYKKVYFKTESTRALNSLSLGSRALSLHTIKVPSSSVMIMFSFAADDALFLSLLESSNSP